jgi:hypothetical protein
MKEVNPSSAIAQSPGANSHPPLGSKQQSWPQLST